MASSSGTVKQLEDLYAQVTIEDEEEVELSYDVVEQNEEDVDYRWALVGTFITKRAIDFDVMRHVMASLWQPGKGMYVKELEPNRFLFQFYHDLDINRVIEGSPWTFNKLQFVFTRLKNGDIPRNVAIKHLDIWVQVHDLQSGFKSAQVLRDLANYIGTFVETDPKNFQGIWREYLRVRVTIDITLPLKRRMKLRKTGSEWFWANFKYEYVPTFCFICGIIGHTERFCPKLFSTLPIGSPSRMVPSFVLPRRRNYQIGSRWLRDGKGKETPFFPMTR
ncbi:uncharacterized protein LOC133034418 [Cannabis sativa]|uniref:uncharacterized protein LOC133034418 n=1 Tax=Cannabis sativa TaxID=3483 RepID=UPI0029CA8EA9|nr:uncharacterized protein LOC133034418 [Cannabis sativa]